MTWEELYAENERLRAKYDAAKLRVAVLEKAHAQVTAERDEALKRIYRLEHERDSGDWCEKERAAKHAANNKCHAVVAVCETVIKWLKRVAPGDAGMAQLMLDVAMNPGEKKDSDG